MLFFRAEEQVRAWSGRRGTPVRPIVTMDELWRLAEAWYSTRLDGHSRRPQPDEMREIFAGIGLVGDFWDPGADSFG